MDVWFSSGTVCWLGGTKRIHIKIKKWLNYSRGLTSKEAGDILQLGDVVILVAAVFLQQGENPVVFVAGVSRVQSLQLLEDFAPCGFLVLGVLHSGDGLATGTKTWAYSVSLWAVFL